MVVHDAGFFLQSNHGRCPLTGGTPDQVAAGHSDGCGRITPHPTDLATSEYRRINGHRKGKQGNTINLFYDTHRTPVSFLPVFPYKRGFAPTPDGCYPELASRNARVVPLSSRDRSGYTPQFLYVHPENPGHLVRESGAASIPGLWEVQITVS